MICPQGKNTTSTSAPQENFHQAFEPIQVTAPLTLMFANIWMINATFWFYPTMCLLPPEKNTHNGQAAIRMEPLWLYAGFVEIFGDR